MVFAPGVAHFVHGLAGGRARCRGRQRHGHFQVGRIAIAVGKRDGVFTGIRQHVEFLGGAAADGAGVRDHRAEPETQPREDRGVRPVHGVVGCLQALLVEVERIGVLHEEFARAHHAETRPALVAELHLDLVEVRRQLAIALELIASDVGDHFLVRRAQAEIAFVPVLDAQQLGTVLLPPAGFRPQLGGNDARHQ